MYPNLRYAVYDILGLDIQSLQLIQMYGFLLALAFLASGWALTTDLKRRERLGLLEGIEEQQEVGRPLAIADIATSAILGFLLGFKGVYAIAHSEVFMGSNAKDAFLSLQHGYWITGILGTLLFVGIKYREKRKELAEYPTPTTIAKTVMPHERVSDIVIIAAISGIVGSKLLYMTEIDYTSFDSAMNDFFSGSGLSIYGGLILGFISVVYYIRKKKIPFFQMVDAAAPAIFLAYGVGRLGCHFSGDGDWGDPNPYTKPFSWLPDWLWAYRYPNNVLNQGDLMTDCGGYPEGLTDFCHILPQGVFVTPVYEFIMSVVIFGILWKLRHGIKAHGLLFFIYLIFNGLERFTIEMVRVNDDYTVGGLNLSQAQYIAIALFTIGVLGTIFMTKRQRDLVAAEKQQNTPL